MTLDPTLLTVTSVVKKLGFKMQKQEKQPKGAQNDMEVNLDAKDDVKVVMSLSYYSNSLMQMQIVDCCVGYLLNKHFDSPIGQEKALTVSMIEEEVKFLYNVIRYEFIEKLKQRPINVSVMDRLQQLQDIGEVVVKDGLIAKPTHVKSKQPKK